MTTATSELYDTLCKVLDKLCSEAPSTATVYHPAPGNHDALVQARSRALLHLFLKARFGIDTYDKRERLVTDGAYDGGIDAYYIDSSSKRIYILQSKFRANAANFAAVNMTANDLLKMDVARVMHGKAKDEIGHSYNSKIKQGLQKAVKGLPDAGSYVTEVLLLGNTKNLSAAQLKKLVDGYSVGQFPHERIYRELLFPVVHGTYFTDPNLTIEILLANTKGDTHLDYDLRASGAKINIKLLFVPTREIGRIMSTYRNSILKYNPRSFLELENNVVNREIESSIKTRSGNEFALYNNGITIISDQTSISKDTAKQGTAQLVIRNPQLVNGGQTAYTLSRIYEECLTAGEFTPFKGKEVVLRVITFVGNISDDTRLSLVTDISRASNSQTKIDESDRRSNDEIQIKLQSMFYERHGLYYERKRGEFSDGLRAGYIASAQIVNREKLLRVALASEYRVAQARSSIAKYFDETTLSSVLKTKDAERYAYGYAVLRQLEARRRAKPKVKGDRYHTKEYGQALRYGIYAVVGAAINVGLTGKKSPDVATAAVLKGWKAFELWLEKQASNAAYLKNGAFDYVNYYKGSTASADLKSYTFAL